MSMLNDQRIRTAADLAYTSAALGTMGSCPIWDARLTGYLGRRALMTANSEFGSSAEGRNLGNANDIMAAEEAHTEQFDKPFWQAAVDLAMTPSPTLRAALFKVELVRQESLYDDKTMPREPMEIVAEDFARLALRADDPVSRYHRALEDFDAGRSDEARYQTAINALDNWAPRTSTDLLRKLLAVLSDANMPENARLARAMEQAGSIFDPTTGQRRAA